MNRWIVVLVVASTGGWAVASPSIGHAQDAREGLVLARGFCSSCHLVEPRQSTPVPDGVPTFEAIAGYPDQTAEAIVARIVKSPHPMMPDPPLTQNQLADVASYIMSQKR